VQDHDHPLLMSGTFEVEELNWLIGAETKAPDDPAAPFECTVKTRYRQSDLECTVELSRARRARVTLRRPARAITPGQYAVFYRGELCLGGGVITEPRCLPRETAQPADAL